MNAIALALMHAPAWRPFLEPLDLHEHWLWLLLPLLYVVALVYKTLKMPTLEGIWLDSARLAGYILLLMAVGAVGLWGIVELV